MAGSTFGTIFRITTWGESHGKAVGVVIDGCPAGLSLVEEDIQGFLDRRKPGQSKYTTKRKEDDSIIILSGVFEGFTTGTPISLMVKNKDQHSKDYHDLATTYRPGHADYTFDYKYGFRDYRGGGRSSGRETIARVAAGAIAIKLLHKLGIDILAYTKAIGSIEVPINEYDKNVIFDNALYMPSLAYAKKAGVLIEECMKKEDSLGGVIECVVKGMPPGIGDTVFEKLDANLSKSIMSIGGIKGVTIGDGMDATFMHGSEHNDAFYMDSGSICKHSNHAGGILGGMSDGDDILLKAFVKPTPSISSLQESVTTTLENTALRITGRHDPIIVPRAVVVVESMVALTLIDGLLLNMGAKVDSICDFYKK